MKQTRTKTLPYKLMVFLLYSQHSSIRRQGDLVHIKLGPLSVRLQVSKSRLAGYIHWLANEGLLTLAHQDASGAIVALAAPTSRTHVLKGPDASPIDWKAGGVP
jgi:hypothetical protein